MARNQNNNLNIDELKKEYEEFKQLGVDEKTLKKIGDAIKKLEKDQEDKEKKKKEAEKRVAEIAKQEKEEERKKKEQKKKVVDNVKKFTKDQKKKKKEDIKDLEEIDQEILDILGLDKFDLEMDPEEYRTLLHEKIQANMQKGQDSSNAKLANERKRVRGSGKKYTAKKKKTVKPSNFVGRDTKKKEEPKKVQTNKLLPSAGQTGGSIHGEDIDTRIEEAKVEIEEDTRQKLIPLSQSLDDINKTLEGILNTNKKKLEIDKQAARDAAKKDETTGFKEKEAKLEEKDTKNVTGGIEKALKPTTSIFDMILNFFKNVLLGGAISGLLEIFTNPAKFLNGLTNFLNDFINFANGIIQQVSQFIFTPFNAVITAINSALNELEWSMKQLANMIPGIPVPKFPDIPLLAIPPIPTIPPGALAKLLGNWMQTQAEGGEVMPDGMSFLDGGAIDALSGMKIKGMGKDTQLIAAQPGEVMMSKKAVDMFGADTLLGMNAAAGGTNKPKYGKVPGMENGGVVPGLGRQGSAPIRDFGTGSGAGSKGYIVVPGHAAGAGAPGEMQLVRALARRTVENLQTKFGPDVPVRLLDMHDETPNTQEGFVIQQNKLKALENQGYEVLEIHMDASLESGYGTGRGVIPPMPGTDDINPVEADFARTAGAFSKTHRGGLAGTNRGVSLIELGNMSPELQNSVLRGNGLNDDQLNALTAPLESSLARGLNLQPGAPSAQITRQKVDVTIQTPQAQNTGTATQVVPVSQNNGQVNSAASAAQGKIPNFTAEDGGNFDLIVVKSIYNIVG